MAAWQLQREREGRGQPPHSARQPDGRGEGEAGLQGHCSGAEHWALRLDPHHQTGEAPEEQASDYTRDS